MTKFDQPKQKTGTQYNADTINVYLSHSLEVLKHNEAIQEEMANLDVASHVINVVPDQEPSENTKKLIEKFGVAKKHFADIRRQERDNSIKVINSELPKELVLMIEETSITKIAEEELMLSMNEWACSNAFENEGIDPKTYGLETSENATKNIQELTENYLQHLKKLNTTIREVQDMIMTPIRNIRK